MTEEDAQAWLDQHRWWSTDAGDRLHRFVDLVIEESDRQNLISASSREQIWSRHIVDSAQLHIMAEARGAASDGLWVDLGTGAGFPGLVVACLRDAPMHLVEVRPLRVAFLQHCVDALGLSHVKVVGAKVERTVLPVAASVISARAYARLDRLLVGANHLSDSSTIWLLPKGRQAENELAIAREHWQAVFHVEQSITDPESSIVTASQLAARPAPPTRQKPASRKVSQARRSRRPAPKARP